jgi:hypothetical protein
MADTIEQVAPGLSWAMVYWMAGESPKGDPYRSEVKDPPHLGWGSCYVVDTGGKLVTLFDPYGLYAYQVSRLSSEYMSLKPTRDPYRGPHMARLLRDKWAQAARHAWQRDFASCAVVMRMLGLEVPMNLVPEGVEVKQTGGKEAGPEGLKKPVKRDGRRGQVLAFFLAGEGGARSIHEATAEMGISRSNVLSQCYLLQKDHGIGYEVAGDVVTVRLPEGCVDPFGNEPTEAQPAPVAEPEAEPEFDPLDC